MLQENCPYALVSRGNMHNRTSLMLLDACYRAEHKTLAEKISKALHKEINEERDFFASLQSDKAELMAQDKNDTEQFAKTLEQIEGMFKNMPPKPTVDSPNIKH